MSRDRPESEPGREDTFCGRTRREFLWEAGGGLHLVALAGLLAGDGFSGRRAPAPPTAWRPCRRQSAGPQGRRTSRRRPRA